MRAYYFNGVLFRSCQAGEEISAGEIFFDHIPNEEELLNTFPLYTETKVAYLNSLAENSRAAAYREESDPLFFKAQRGEATQQEWLDKIQEIKNRFPKVN